VIPGLQFGLAAGVLAVSAEWCYKQPWAVDGPWIKYVWVWLPMQLGIGYCIYRLVNLPGTNLLDAFIVFAFCTALLRIIVASAILGQTIPIQSWIGFGLVLSATLVKTFWEKFS
jgi:hypothetical protein